MLVNVLICVKDVFHILKNKNNIPEKLMFVYICDIVQNAVSYSPFRFVPKPVDDTFNQTYTMIGYGIQF